MTRDEAPLISTRSVAPARRAEFWRDLVCDVFVRLDCTKIDPAFRGSLRTTHLSDIQLSEIDTEAHAVARGRHHLNRVDDEAVLLSVQHAGRCRVAQDGRVAELLPGDCGVYAANRPYTLTFDEPMSETILKIPRAVLSARFVDVDRLCARRIHGSDPHAQIFRMYLEALRNRTHGFDPSDKSKLAGCLLDLMSLAVHASLGPAGAPPSPGRSHHVFRIKAFIEQHLADPDLTVDLVAQRHGMSARYVQKLFEDEGLSPARWIWKRRLTKCREALAAPEFRAQTITEIAFRWGFSHPAHFSRAFKAAFGQTPREFRNSVLG